jgi:hypothetical protein
MRVFKKYKTWSQINTSNFFPLRILKFKKTKWKKIKKILLRTKNSCLFLEHSIQVLPTKTWDRIKNYYKTELGFKLNLKKRYDCKLLSNKKILPHEKSYIINNFIKTEYRLDLLLYSLNFFASIYQARQSIKNGLVLINNKPSLSENTVLIKGDIVCLLGDKNNLPQMIKKELRFSFLEIDYYTQTFIILKNLNAINFQDIIYNFNEKI